MIPLLNMCVNIVESDNKYLGCAVSVKLWIPALACIQTFLDFRIIMNLQNSKEQFLRTLNLVATRNIKVKYCRTIKERLRPKTQEENLSLPSQSKFKSPTKKKSDDLKPVGSLSPEKPVKNVLQHDDGVAFIKSYKNRKKSRKKSFTNVISPPSSKSLLRLDLLSSSNASCG